LLQKYAWTDKLEDSLQREQLAQEVLKKQADTAARRSALKLQEAQQVCPCHTNWYFHHVRVLL